MGIKFLERRNTRWYFEKGSEIVRCSSLPPRFYPSMNIVYFDSTISNIVVLSMGGVVGRTTEDTLSEALVKLRNHGKKR